MEQNNNKQNTALLVMDMQNTIVNMLPDKSVVNKVAKAIGHARGKKMPVIYVVVGFRKGAPEISPNNKGFSAAKERFNNAGMSPEEWVKIHVDVAPQDGDIIVTKRRVSAFTGSDLGVVLRGQSINHLVLTGIATSGVVLSTVREAADKDFGITVLANACADGDEEVHRVLTTKVFPRQADVMTLEEWDAK